MWLDPFRLARSTAIYNRYRRHDCSARLSTSNNRPVRQVFVNFIFKKLFTLNLVKVEPNSFFNYVWIGCNMTGHDIYMVYYGQNRVSSKVWLLTKLYKFMTIVWNCHEWFYWAKKRAQALESNKSFIRPRYTSH